MEIFTASKLGNIEKLRALLQGCSGVDKVFRNPQFERIDEARPKSSMYCAACYQVVKRRSRDTLNGAIASSFLCDSPTHQRRLLVTGADVDVGCCSTPSVDLCDWAVCLECITKCTYNLKALHQMYGLQEGYTALIAASSGGHLECVRLLLDNGFDVNLADPKGLTPLLAAASGGHAEVVRLLLTKGAFIDAVDYRGLCALFMACEAGDAATVEVILSFGPDMTIADLTGASVLHAAVAVGDLRITHALLIHGHRINVTDKEGSTPLHFLPNNGSSDLVQLLLEHGAEVNARDKLKIMPIKWTCLRNNVVTTTALLGAGAHVGREILRESCFKNFPKIVDVLLASGLRATEQNEWMACAMRNCPDVAEVLFKYGVKGAGDGLKLAARSGHTAVVKVILQHWTGENTSDLTQADLNYALLGAAQKGTVPLVKLLLQHGADAVAVSDESGRTAVDLAASKTVKVIIQAHLVGDAIETEEDNEESLENNREHLLNALKKGTKKWGRSKIMIVGDGRAGKTALANSIMGEEFVHTESTIGINQMTCDVKFAEVGREGQWDEYVKPDKELEAALAKIVAARRNGEDDAGEIVFPGPATHSANTLALASVVDASGTEELSVATSATNVSSVFTDETGRADLSAETSALVIDDALVMRYLANMTENTKFTISLFDYGGQSVFNVIHHLFLTRYGVYTLVFNMEQLVSNNPAVVDHCLSTMSFWLNSVIMHTWDAKSKSMAPIIIIGTHKDVVNTPEEHKKISRILYDKLTSSVAWPWIQENEESEEDVGALSFFPVDNTKGRKDSTIVKIMRLIEDLIDKSDYVHVERPLSWLQTIDKLTSSGKVYLSLLEVEAIAQECNVLPAAVPSMLRFLHEMGILMWHDDVSLRDVVILDAVSYFVFPATTIICKHVATTNNNVRHTVDVHKKCSKQHYSAWIKLVHQGIASSDVLEFLLQECGSQTPVVLRLMIKFGLVVPLLWVDRGGSMEQNTPRLEEYLVPALLPLLTDDPFSPMNCLYDSGEYPNSCYFVFSCSTLLSENSSITFADTTKQGFLPRGLFERLICKAVEWCRETSAVQSLQSQPLFQDAAVLIFGNQKFRMRAYHDKNVIEVNFARGNPLAVHQRLCEQLRQILNECMKSLCFFTAVPLQTTHSADGSADMPLVSLDNVRESHRRGVSIFGSSNKRLLDKNFVEGEYSDWLEDLALRSDYDVFISYRWCDRDSSFVERLRDRLLIFNVGNYSRAVTVFLDNKRLKDGRNFVDDFAHALINSLIVVPIVSSDALDRMLNHDPEQKDHALMEWFMALECFYSSASRVVRVLPALFGTRTGASDKIENLLSEGLLDAMPKIHPSESLRVATRLLRENGVEPRAGVSAYTVHSILMEIKSIQAFCAWRVKNPFAVVAKAADTIFNSLQEAIKEGPKRTKNTAGQSGSARTLKEVVDDIRTQLGLGAELNAAQVFQQALDYLGDAFLVEACSHLTGLAKGEKILRAVLGSS